MEAIPRRSGDWHLNVNKFVEPGHCGDCLKISGPHVLPDGTLEFHVTLKHPFPNTPRYTGFDVRGTVMFPATRYWSSDEFWLYYADPWDKPVFPDGKTPLYFSLAADGGGELLNPDGYSFYLWPGLDVLKEQPIFNYYKGEYACGPDPDSTINGFKLFTSDPTRRMFRVHESITRVYHIAPPEGAFTFGYVVDASWVAPTTTPVTNPAEDFPFWANCEEGYILEFDQIKPFKTGLYEVGNPDAVPGYFYAYFKFFVYPEESLFGAGYFWIYCHDIIPDEEKKSDPISQVHWPTFHGDGVWDYQISTTTGYYEAEPGQYPAVLLHLPGYYYEDDYPVHFKNGVQVAVVWLDVIEGD